ncbi:hypothetical protein A4X13_0g3999 [Tilletia indica]|uniref:Uncharacterized protein n=1 Tax=Tilletia indica TaxID=43049 RepID=A0A177TE25_9BASI|nr:hypothetical protein A4X13_0g3999 [Tilletia indica]
MKRSTRTSAQCAPAFNTHAFNTHQRSTRAPASIGRLGRLGGRTTRRQDDPAAGRLDGRTTPLNMSIGSVRARVHDDRKALSLRGMRCSRYGSSLLAGPTNPPGGPANHVRNITRRKKIFGRSALIVVFAQLLSLKHRSSLYSRIRRWRYARTEAYCTGPHQHPH